MGASTVSSRGTRDYRHVVFSDELRGPGCALNFSPLGADPEACPTQMTPAQSAFVHWLFEQAGLNAGWYRHETLARRLPACLRALRAGSLQEARGRIESMPRLILAGIDAMLIGVSSFFRDRAVFEALDERIVPALLSERPAQEPLRVWSAGCSHGAEIWSMALLLAERGALPGARLLGTDCRPTALRLAAAGMYDEDEVRHVPRALLRRHFSRTEDRWQIGSELRGSVVWRRSDVLDDHEPGRWDLILCRNLAIYLRPECVARLWQRLYDALAPGGLLVVGKAERPTGLPLRCVLPCIFRRDRGTDR